MLRVNRRRWTRPVSRVGLGTLAVVLAVLAGCGAPPGSPAPSGSPGPAAGGSGPTTAPGAVPRPEHVLLVIFENRAAGQVIGSADAPYLNSLARSGATFTNAHAETHPSEPNYIALFSGSTHGVSDDSCPVALTGPNLAAQLLAAGKSFVGYSEGMPSQGYTGCDQDKYARRHNPWVNFADLPTTVNQPLSAMPADYAQLPTVSIVVPDLCHDMHDCSVATGDSWARTFLTPYVQWAGAHNSLLVVTFDEDDTNGAPNQIPTVLVGPMVRPGETSQFINHYSLLRMIEDMYGLAPIGQAADARPISQIWTSGS